MKYMAVYAGDTGVDHGLFYGGTYDTVEEAVKAVKKGLESCYCYAGFGYVMDESGRYVVAFSGSGDVIYDAREEESK